VGNVVVIVRIKVHVATIEEGLEVVSAVGVGSDLHL
jgi:hypothetical protein